jgi:electron transfer flavoprotein alpha subunit
MWVRVGARLTAEQLVDVLDISLATTMLAGARPLAGGSSRCKGVIRDRPIIDFLQRTCVSTSMKAATRGP